MGSIRDQQCSADIAKMAELGRFDDEITVYGTVWLAEGQRRYYLTTDSEAAYRFVREKLLQGLYPVPVTCSRYRVPVLAGRAAEDQQKAKIALGKKLQKQYPAAFLAEAAALAQVPRDDQALAPLQAAQEWLTGRFQREELLSFRALAEEAYIAKKLTDQTYQELCQWQAHCLSQLEDDVMTRERYSREYSGFYYWPSQETSNKARLYLDGQPQLVYEKQDLLRAQGCRLTPILRKTYWLGSMSENKLSRARFQQEAEKLWHSPLGTAVEALAALPPAVDASAIRSQLAALAQQERWTERQALKIWAALWNVYDAGD